MIRLSTISTTISVIGPIIVLVSVARAQPVVDIDLGTDGGAHALENLRVPAAGDLSVELHVRGNYTGEKTRALIGTKPESGADEGWVLTAHRSGAWQWSLGDGEHAWDYRPTAARQGLFDDRWHRIGFSLDREHAEARLYFDGANVAVYALDGLRMPEQADATPLILGDGFIGRRGRLRVWDEVRPLDEPASPPAAAAPPETLSVMAWNIWHGGRENGAETGVQQVIDVIRDAKVDIVCMQETYGSGPIIADALGWSFYLRSSNLSIMSRFPIRETADVYRPFFSGGARLDLGGGRDLRVYSLWIHHLPDIDVVLDQPDVTAADLVAGEGETRLAEIRGILADMADALDDADTTPVVLAGDFNSPSHQDWDARTSHAHRGLVVPWPVSRACADVGLVDTYRAVHDDPRTAPGHTWSPRFGYSERIDYVYARGPDLVPFESIVIDEHAVRFPSDHAAVVTRFRLRVRSEPGP